MKSHFQIVILGGGTAGVMTASQLVKQNAKLKVAIIEPSNIHFYQPAWTLVGAGSYSFGKTAKPTEDVIPKGVTWIRDRAKNIIPDDNTVVLENTGLIYYQYIVVATGLVINTGKIEGLPEALEKGIACSNYINPQFTWQTLRKFKGGNAIFAQPNIPIKNVAASQKASYLAADYIHKKGIEYKSKVILTMPYARLFRVKEIRKALMQVIDRYGIHFRPYHNPIRIDVANKVIHFKLLSEEIDDLNGDKILKEIVGFEPEVVMPFEMLHIAPPMFAPNFIRTSKLAGNNGLLNVNQYSLQHNSYGNIFGIGDVASLPTLKTAGAISKQVPIVVDNLLYLITKRKSNNRTYNGYSLCPIVTGYGKTTIAEFDYKNQYAPDNQLKKLLFVNNGEESRRSWLLKKYGFPFVYWNRKLKGK